MKQSGVEQVYRYHHGTRRGEGFNILSKERGSFLREKIGKGKRILDIGCRDGALTAAFAEGNEVLGLDIDTHSLEVARRKLGIETRHMDLNAEWDLEPGSFDVVVAAEVLEHLYYPGKVVEKISDVLRRGGILVGSVPHAFSLQNRIKYLLGMKRGSPLQDPTHINHFSYKEFRALLSTHFQNIEMRPLTTRRYRWLRFLFPYLFAHTFLFCGVKKDIL
jgi:2-polyprenyl-3-methyl-5-hydroxy-6-metoxy-1,4-benzoquinol methylase